MAATLGVPVTVMATTGEGGPWGGNFGGINAQQPRENLPDYLSKHVFSGVDSTTLQSDLLRIRRGLQPSFGKV